MPYNGSKPRYPKQLKRYKQSGNHRCTTYLLISTGFVYMTVCTKCSDEIDDGTLLAGTDVYGEMAGGNDRDDLLAAYNGIRYGRETVICAECLDTPSECRKCDGTGEVLTDDDETTAAESCLECNGTGTTKPDLLRNSCK